MQVYQEKGQQVNNEKDGRRHHKSPGCQEHGKSNGLYLTLCKKKEEQGKYKKVKPLQNTLQVRQILPKEVGHDLQLCPEMKEQESLQHHDFPIFQAFESDRGTELQLRQEKEKRNKDEKARQGKHVLEMPPEDENYGGCELHPCPEKGEMDIPCQHKPQVCLVNKLKKGHKLLLVKEKEKQESKNDMCEHGEREMCQMHGGYKPLLGQEKEKQEKYKEDSHQPNRMQVCQESGMENRLQVKPFQEKGEKVNHQVVRPKPHRRPPCQNLGNEKRHPLQLSQEKDKEDKDKTNRVLSHKLETSRERESQQQLKRHRKKQLPQQEVNSIATRNKLNRECGSEQQPKRSRKKQLSEQEVNFITAQIRERERRRKIRRQQMEESRIMKMNAEAHKRIQQQKIQEIEGHRITMTTNIGRATRFLKDASLGRNLARQNITFTLEIQTFDDVAMFFSPEEWKEWKEVEEFFQREDIKDLPDVKHLLGNQSTC